MSQGIRVLQCFECKTYQVDMVKKANRWQCKMCGAKQSLRKVYFRGTGAECRVKVQELNKRRELETQADNDVLLQSLSEKDINREKKDVTTDNSVPAERCRDTGSKWTTYLEPENKSAVFDAENDFTKMKRGGEHLFSFGSTRKWPTIESGNPGKSAGSVQTKDTSEKLSKWGAFV